MTLKFTNNALNSHIFADSDKIHQALRNLFINAIKFSPEDSEIKASMFDAEIEFVDMTKEDGLYFKLQDQGIGIPENELDEIFKPFVIGSLTKSKAGGTGLGLSIVKEIIKAHNGKIWASKNEKEGSSFHILLPNSLKNERKSIINYKIINNILDSHEVDIIETKREKPKKLNILIIDDEEFNIRSLGIIINSLGHNSFSGLGGMEGLKFLKENSINIDLVLLDLMMHDMYGINVLSEIKEDPKLAHIHVILQTASSDEAEINKAYSMGAISCIQKPYTSKIVEEAINKAEGLN